MGGGDGVADPLSRAAAADADAADPLAGFRDRFVPDAAGVVYLDGNSLGRLPRATRDRLAAATAEWGERLVGGWPDWIDAPERTGDALAPLIGAGPGEVLVCDSTTVNLFKLLGAAIEARRPKMLVVRRDEFPTDRYIARGLRARGADPRWPRSRSTRTSSAASWSCSRTSTTAPARCATWRRSRRGRTRSAPPSSGT